jgi:hypothetical protein
VHNVHLEVRTVVHIIESCAFKSEKEGYGGDGAGRQMINEHQVSKSSTYGPVCLSE